MITRRIGGTIMKSSGGDALTPLSVEFVYDPDWSPLAVTMIFHLEDEEVCWTVDRELMMDGVTSLTPVGDGDVKFRWEGEKKGGLLLCLDNPSGHADIRFRQVQVVEFLEATTRTIPVGRESIEDKLDEWIEEALASE